LTVQFNERISGAVTSTEIAEQTGWNRQKVNKLVKFGLAAGLIKMTKKLVPSIAGHPMRVPAWLFVTKKKQK
jgi:hypothetical protein